MKTLRIIAIAIALCTSALAWTCPTNQHWVQVAAGTSGATIVEGITFQCQPNAPTTPTGTALTNTNNNTAVNTNSNSNTNNSASNSASNSNATANSTANQTQQQTQQQRQTANGGNASSNAQGGNAASTSSAANNGNGSNNTSTTVEAPKIPVASAIAPTVLPSAPCVKGFSGAAQGGVFGISGGFGKTDEGCDARELARAFSGPQTVASCKILLATKKAKDANISMEDCLGTPTAKAAPTAKAPILVSIPDVHDMKNFPEPVCLEILTTKSGESQCLRYAGESRVE